MMIGLVTEKFGDPAVSPNESEFGDAPPTDETYCSFKNAEETPHLVTEDPHTDTTAG